MSEQGYKMTNPNKLRERIAIAALEIGINKYGFHEFLDTAKMSVQIADALIVELNKSSTAEKAKDESNEEKPFTLEERVQFFKKYLSSKNLTLTNK